LEPSQLFSLISLNKGEKINSEYTQFSEEFQKIDKISNFKMK